MNCFFYRVDETGMITWECFEEDGGPGHPARTVITSPVLPDFPVYIHSPKYGRIVSTFDPETTVFPGVRRDGFDGNGRAVLSLVWWEDRYDLFVEGEAFTVRPGAPSRNALIVEQNGKTVAKIADAGAVHIDLWGQINKMRQLWLDPAYRALLEIIVAVPVLLFFPFCKREYGP